MSRIVLLDGGMGQELIKRCPGEPTPLWSARVIMDAPELVKEVHLDYIRAGARVITVNAYSVTRDRLERGGHGERFAELQGTACRLAKEARDESGEDVTIAGCLPPLMWSYRPDLAANAEENAPVYAEIAALQAPHVDLFLCETMSAASQALGAVRGAVEGGGGKPVWVAWTLSETLGPDGQPRLRSGETVAEAVAALDGLAVQALLFNCCPPEAIGPGLPALAADGRPYGGYANAFTPIPKEFSLGRTVDMLGKRTDLDSDAYAGHVMGWVGQGATIVGGCCETAPAHIAEIARRLSEAGHRIVAPSGAVQVGTGGR